MAAKIFLAHASEDKPQVRKLYAELKARGFDPWLDEKDLRAGQIWKVEIPKAIHGARLFLACLSSRSVGKIGYVQIELREALAAYGERPPGSIYVVPVRLDECEVPDLQIPNLSLSLRDIHRVDLWQAGGIERLVSDLQHALDGATHLQAFREEAPRTPPRKETRTRAKATEAKLAAAGEPKPGKEPGASALRRRVFRDLDESWCPEMVVIPPGTFLMGSTEPERRWCIAQGLAREWAEREKPQHQVVIPEAFAIGKYPEATDREMNGDCWIYMGGSKLDNSSSANWVSPGFEQTDNCPVVDVSWEDAKAYVAWLTEKTNQLYRLLSEAEWEYACRAGTTTRYSWGNDIPTPNQVNFGMNMHRTTEVGSYPPNPWGLYDMHGNVWEWVEDCWNESYQGAPTDGSAWTGGDCYWRGLRGGSWSSGPVFHRSATRAKGRIIARGSFDGFGLPGRFPEAELAP